MPGGPEIEIRECVSVDDFHQCIELERLVWKDDDIDIMPVRLYMLAKKCNSPTFGAFEPSGRLVGFGHTMISLQGRNVAMHSHMVGVIEELRGQDLGYRIKLAQRNWAIAAGVQLIFWTFDPLSSRNAHFNINKLGAVIRSYEENYYSEGFSSVFDANLPSDRVIAEWWVSSAHVRLVLAGQRPRLGDGPGVDVPDDIDAIRSASSDEHRYWRFRVREGLQAALEHGIVRGFGRDPKLGLGRYLIGPDDDEFKFKN